MPTSAQVVATVATSSGSPTSHAVVFEGAYDVVVQVLVPVSEWSVCTVVGSPVAGSWPVVVVTVRVPPVDTGSVSTLVPSPTYRAAVMPVPAVGADAHGVFTVSETTAPPTPSSTFCSRTCPASHRESFTVVEPVTYTDFVPPDVFDGSPSIPWKNV